MPTFTKTPLLGEQVGLQYDKLQDHTGSTSNTSSGVPLVIGFFKRGTPFSVVSVNKENLKAILGYTPNNPHYKTIEQMLAQNVGRVNVLNLGSKNRKAKN